MKRLLVLVNPSSHGGRSGRRWRSLAERLPEGEFVILESIEDAYERARTARGFEAVVACGGDGTIRAVAEGVLKNEDARLKFGVLYTGTSPDFCRTHAIPTNPEGAISLLRAGATRAIPVLTANGRAFFCSLNLGIGAEVAAVANRLRPKLGDGFGTFIALLRALFRSYAYSVRLGDELLADRLHVLVTRIPFIAGGLKLALPELRDDEYAVWSVRRPGFFGWPRLLWRLYRGKPCGELIICRESRRVTSSEDLPVEFDGDPKGRLPVEIRFDDRRLNLICP